MSEPIARAAVWLARGHVVLTLLGLVAGGVTALAMRIALWQPEGSGDPEGYGRLFALHGAAMVFMVVMPAMFGALASLVVPEAMRARALPTIPLAAIGLLVWTCGAIVQAALTLTADQSWTFYAPDQARGPVWIPTALVVLGMLLTLVHHVVVVLANIRGARPLAIVVVAGVLGPMAWLCWACVSAIVTHLRDPWTGPLDVAIGTVLTDTMYVHVIAALAILTHLTSRGLDPDSVWPRRAAAGLVGVAAWYIATPHWVVGTLGLGGATMLIALWLFAIHRTRGWRDPLALAVIFGVAPALLVFGFARFVLTHVAVDIHLHDTWFVLGAFHIGAAIVGLVWIGGLYVWTHVLFARHARAWPARIGVVLVGLGVVVQSIAMLQLGSAGMPRRYASYVAEYTGMQQLASCAVFAGTFGALLVVVSFARGHRSGST